MHSFWHHTITATIMAGIASLAIATQAHAQAAQGYALEVLWETNDLIMPESVLTIPNHDWIYVSVINTEDAKGYIARLGKDGSVDTAKWVDGIQTPTGMTARDGFLYVVDQTQVHKIDLATASIVQSFPAETAKTLNDIDVTADGQFLISDLTTGTLHTIENDRIVEWTSSDAFKFPNGVFIDGDTVLIGDVGAELSRDLTPDQFGSIYSVDLADKSVEVLAGTETTGTWDGIAPFADGILASSPITGELWYFYDGRKSLIGKVSGGIADIGTDPEAGIVYAPMINDNKVVAYKLNPFDWTRVRSKSYFEAQVADQYFGDEGGASIANSDGTIEGTFGGQELKGTFEFKDGLFCRTSTLGDLDLGSDCIVLEVTDTQMRLQLLEGKGISVIYDRQPAK